MAVKKKMNSNVIKEKKVNNSKSDAILKKSDIKSIVSLLRKHYGWIYGGITLIIAFISIIFRFSRYINLRKFFNFYGLNFDFVNNKESSILLDAGFSFMMSVFLVSLLLCMYMFLFKPKKKKNWDVLKYIIGIVIFDLVLLECFNDSIIINRYDFSIIWNIISHYVPSVIAVTVGAGFVFLVFYLFHVFPTKVSDKVFRVIDSLIFISFGVGVVFLYYNYSYNMELSSNKVYTLVDDNTVIIYSNEDYYLTLDCAIKEEDNKRYLLIYRYTQNKISTNDTKTVKKTFDDVYFFNDYSDEEQDSKEDKIE